MEVRKLKRIVAMSVVIAASGCGGPAWDEPDLHASSDVAAVRAASPSSRGLAAPEITGEVTLGQAIELALRHNPDAAGAALSARAAEARIRQARRRPNPEVELELEEFGGTGDLSGFDAMAAVVVVGQEIETGAKRARRAALATAGKNVATAKAHATVAELVAEVRNTFTGILAAQAGVELAREAVGISKRTADALAERVEAGKEVRLHGIRALVALSKARLDLKSAERELEAARGALASTWGASTPAFSSARGDLASMPVAPKLEQLLGRLDHNADVANAQAELDTAVAALGVERANARPNPAVGAGVQMFQESGDTALVVGFSMPIAVFDRNRDEIRAASLEAEAAREALRSSRIAAEVALRKTYGELLSAHDAAVHLRDEILPAARRAFDAATTGLRAGKFAYLEVLDAQQELIEARTEYIKALAEYREALTEAHRLTGATGSIAPKED
jgi:cobalt-zinc-cadmium efflux system outer membrane protein